MLDAGYVPDDFAMWLQYGTLLSSYTRIVGKILTEPSLHTETNRGLGGGGGGCQQSRAV